MNKHISVGIISALIFVLYAVPVFAAEKRHEHSSEGQAHDAQPHHGADEAKPHDEHGSQSGEAAHDHGDASYSVGEPAIAADADRTVEVVMADAMTYTFSPDIASIRDGEVINFVVINNGKINHEFSIGNQEDQKEHAAMMVRMPNMVHDDPNTVTVPPGESKSLAWRFKGDDLVVFACNVPGHYQAGMFKKSAIVAAEERGHGDHSH